MRISDWSSDVCSSDLFRRAADETPAAIERQRAQPLQDAVGFRRDGPDDVDIGHVVAPGLPGIGARADPAQLRRQARSEEHTSELQSLMRISYAVFCLKKKKYT